MSTSLLDSDPSVSRRYSSDISRRPSAFDDLPSHAEQSNEQMHLELEAVQRPLNPPGPVEETVPVITVGYLIPRSPCASDNRRQFLFPPNIEPKRKLDLDRRGRMPGKSLFGSCEAIQEMTEDEDSVSALNTPAKRPHNLRRKSCGDKASHLNKLHFRLAKTLRNSRAENDNVKAESASGSADSKLLEVTNSHSVQEDQIVQIPQKKTRNIPQPLPSKRQYHQVHTSKSADRLASPTLADSQTYSRESRRNTLNVPPGHATKDNTCMYLTVPSTLTPFIPRPPCAQD